MLSAAVLPWLKATSQCSIRIGRPWTGLSYSQMSPGGEDAGHRGLELSRALHAARLADLEPGALRKRHVRSHPGADHHQVAVEREPAPRHDPLDAVAGALEALELLAPVNLDPVLFEHALEVAPDLLAVEALERHVLQHHHRALVAVGGGADAATLRPDVAAADDHDALMLGLLPHGLELPRARM